MFWGQTQACTLNTNAGVCWPQLVSRHVFVPLLLVSTLLWPAVLSASRAGRAELQTVLIWICLRQRDGHSLLPACNGVKALQTPTTAAAASG